MNIDKDIIGKPPNQAVVINDKLINRQLKEKENHSKNNQVLSEPFTDTREKLEADVRDITINSWVTAPLYKVTDWLNRQAAITKNECREENRKRLGELHALLDEAARKREELAWRVDYNGELVEKVKQERNNLQEQVDSLTTERDHFRKHVNWLIDLIADIARKQPHTFDPEAPYETLDTIGDYLDELHGNVASLTAERDKLLKQLAGKQHVIDVQRDSFRKMEVELSKAKAVEQ